MTRIHCPNCGSKNCKLINDKSDNWNDLCILCYECGYDEREQKKLIEKKEDFSPEYPTGSNAEPFDLSPKEER
jgi:uncharacterized Zn finger protein